MIGNHGIGSILRVVGIILMAGIFSPVVLSAQQYITPLAGQTQTFTVAGGEIFTDPRDAAGQGGPGGVCTGTSSGNIGDYPNCGCTTVTTLCAPTGGRVSINFTTFTIFGNFDFLTIHDGSNTSAPVIFNSNLSSNTDELAGIIAAYGSSQFTSTGQCLTISFTATTVVNSCGWTAGVTLPAGTPGGGGGTATCSLICAGNQTITLEPGACQYEIPNLVTLSVDNCSYTIAEKSQVGTGDLVGPGSYTLSYDLLTATGLKVESCTIGLTVLPTPDVVDNVVCNDHVNITVDENCKVTLTADAFLEGGPYSCYDNYQINILPNQSDAAKISNVPQGVALTLPYGFHGYEVVAASGLSCAGTFRIEDKQAPIVTCKCVDDPTITPVSSFSGVISTTDPTFSRPTGTTTCTQGTPPKYYDVYPFQVSVTGSYTFNANGSQGDTYAIIYRAPFDPANPCVNFIVANDDGAGDLDPLITTTLTAGVDYVLVFTTFGTSIATGNYTINMTGAGQIQVVTNPANAPECQFRCVDLDVVSRETVGMLYNIPGQNANKAKLSVPPTVTDCSNLKIRFEDRIEPSLCGKTKLVRDWTFEDASGNVSGCTQTFSFRALEFSDLTPPAAEVQLTCGINIDPASVAAYVDVDSRSGTPSTTNTGAYADDWTATPGVVELNEGFSSAYYTYKQIGFDGMQHDQKVDITTCNLNFSYQDDIFSACGLGCGGNQKVVRTWQIFDDCNRKVTESIQVINAIDNKAPEFEVSDVTIPMDPIGCQAEWIVAQPKNLTDNCNRVSELKWGVLVPEGLVVEGVQLSYKLKGIGIGKYPITYWAEDCCGNRSEKTMILSAVDLAPPVALAKKNIVLSLSGSGVDKDGVAKLYTWQVDNGSFDNCSPVKVEIRRKSGGACGNTGVSDHNNNSTYNSHNEIAAEVPQQSWFHPADSKNDTDGGLFVTFCCEDIPTGQPYGEYDVELRVWDDANQNAIYGDNLIVNGIRDNYSTTWATVRVENKLVPAIVCPKEVTVTCDTDLTLSLENESPVAGVDFSITGLPVTSDLCTSLDMTYRDVWIGNSNILCKTGTIRRDFFVEKGANTSSCSQIITVGGIGKAFTVTFPQRGGTTEWNSCALTLDDVRNTANSLIKRPIADYGQCDVVGENIVIDTFLFEDGACKKWKVTYSYINWCTGQEISSINGQPLVHYYTYKDETAPVLACENSMVSASPLTVNPNGPCVGTVKLTATASDALICADESWVKWESFVDLWADGTIDRLGSSFVNKAWNGIWARIDRFLAGQPNPAWVALQNQHAGIQLANTVYVTYVVPSKASGGGVSLPDFVLTAENIAHKVEWKVTDGCGNYSNCSNTVMVVDKKAPTPYCVGISTAFMQSTPRMVELWARDFDKGSFDQCTPQSKLYFTFKENGVETHPILTRLNDEHFFKGAGLSASQTEYNSGKAFKWLPSSRTAGKVFTSSGKISLDIVVWDESFNRDFCTVDLTIIDNGPAMTKVAGHIHTQGGVGMPEAEVTPVSQVFGPMNSVMTDNDGEFQLDIADDTELRVRKDGDDVNGVTTLDLVMIQRHILGLQRFDSPYQWIAADANNDGRLSAADLTEIRKLILQLTNVFANNDSWRFPVKSQPMDPANPFPYKEAIMAYAGTSVFDFDFVAVKTGDVNGSAKVNGILGNTEPRSSRNLSLLYNEIVRGSGTDVVAVPVYSAQPETISGIQLSLIAENAEIIDVIPGLMDISNYQFSIIENVLRMSVASSQGMKLSTDVPLFTIMVRLHPGVVKTQLKHHETFVRNEAYSMQMEVLDVLLSRLSAGAENQTITLLQNEPNPFRHLTKIIYTTFVSGAVTITVSDVTGRTVFLRQLELERGQHVISISKEELPGSGVYYYSVENGGESITKKMILVE